MECTFNDLKNFPISNNRNCGVWPSKVNYNAFALGYQTSIIEIGTTPQYSVLYVDFPSDIISNPNYIEGGIRPPC